MREQNSATDDNSDKKYTIALFSIHGLIRGGSLELGRDADTGGQTKYLVEVASALGKHPQVERVDLFTRMIDDKRVSQDYAQKVEPLNDRARIVRIPCGAKGYRRKELLWPCLDEFVDNTLKFLRSENIMPDWVHGHYADAGYVALELSQLLGVPFVFTGHSLGRNKLQVLQHAGLSAEEIDKHYHIQHRIRVEENALRKADLVIASTGHEVERGYELYDAHKSARYSVIPPGINVDTFYPYYYDSEEGREIDEAQLQATVKMRGEIGRFLNNPNKPLILAVSRPDRRKNIGALVTAYGEDKELQSIANLAIFAGVRKDIAGMDDNEREVLTELLLLMDKYDLYGKLALPKKHDPTTEIPGLYRLAASSGGVFINPALVENFGITIIEAASSGLPVVSTNHGGPQDIIKNCDCGILIDVRNPEEIGAALKKILVDPDLWRSFSNNGVIGVRKHYSWKAHVEKYLGNVQEILEAQHAETKGGAIGKHLRGVERMVITDIDNILMGDAAALAELRDTLEGQRSRLAFGYVTGRSLEGVKRTIQEEGLPQPDIVIASAGSEIYYGADYLCDQGYSKYISHDWKPNKLRAALADLRFLMPQEAENQRAFKISYYMDAGEERLERIQAALTAAKLRYSLHYALGRYLDLLPPRASKGKAIRYLADKWGLSAEAIAVAGDPINDEEMLRGAYRAIVVGRGDTLHLRGSKRLYIAQEGHAKGVLEGLRHYDFL